MSSMNKYFPTSTAPPTDPRPFVWRQSIFRHMYMQNLMQTFLSSASRRRSASVKSNAAQSSSSINSTKGEESEVFAANCRIYDIIGSRNKNLQRSPSTVVPSALIRYSASMESKPARNLEVKLSDNRNRNQNGVVSAENNRRESSKIVNWLIDPPPALPRCSNATSTPEATGGRSVSFTPSSPACGDCSEINGTYWHASESNHQPPPLGSRSQSRISDAIVPTTNVRSPPPLSSSSAFGASDSTGSWQNGVASARLTWLTSSSVIADYQCRMCSKRYATIGAARLHARTHTLPCRCPACGKAFSRPWLLRGHWRTHTGERPFQCPDPSCRRAFADRSNLRAHLQTHADVKKHACVRCSKTFSRVSLLAKHRRTCERGGGQQLHELSQIAD